VITPDYWNKIANLNIDKLIIPSPCFIKHEYENIINCIESDVQIYEGAILKYIAPYIVRIQGNDYDILERYNTKNIICIEIHNGDNDDYSYIIDMYNKGCLPSLLYIITHCDRGITLTRELVEQLNLLEHIIINRGYFRNGPRVKSYINKQNPLYDLTRHINYFRGDKLNPEIIEWYKIWKGQKSFKRS
jgi:hypothetical protein